MKILSVVLLVFALSYGVGNWLKHKKQRVNNSQVYISDCDLASKECHISNRGHDYKIKLIGVPTALSPFEVSVEVADEQPNSIFIQFDMEGMDMGYNLHSLKKEGAIWKERVVLPVCSLGRNDWLVTLRIDYDEYSNEDKFHLIQ